jgi:2-phosphosulfolactate phosphatase
MKIIRESLFEGAKRAQGVAIVIDVFRAFTSTPLFFHFGASKVLFVHDPDEAFSLKAGNGDVLLAGEVDDRLIPGFDLGNSPSEIASKPPEFFRGKVVVQRTTAGVIGVLNALDSAKIVILGSYVMARAISRYILSQDPLPEAVTIVATGYYGVAATPEDEGCADYLEHLIIGSHYDHLEALKGIVFHESAQKFIRGDKDYFPREDPLFCLQRDLFDFILLASKQAGVVTVEKKQCVK